MKILIVNDDGIQAPGIWELAKWAQKLGEVTVAAPKVEQSGKSQSIQLHEAFEVQKRDLAPGITGYAVNSSPADCVRYALTVLNEKFDLVLSGVNRGLNIGPELMYSGTAGAATEAAFHGINTLAISSKMAYYDRAVSHMDDIYDFVVRNELFSLNNFYNINIPNDTNGKIRVTRQGKFRYEDVFTEEAPGKVAIPLGPRVYDGAGNGEYDIDAMMAGDISITPITLERTQMDVYWKLREAIQ